MRGHVPGQGLGGCQDCITTAQCGQVPLGTSDDVFAQFRRQGGHVRVGCHKVTAIHGVVGLVHHENAQTAGFSDHLLQEARVRLAVDDEHAGQLHCGQHLSRTGGSHYLERHAESCSRFALLLHPVVPTLRWIGIGEHDERSWPRPRHLPELPAATKTLEEI